MVKGKGLDDPTTAGVEIEIKFKILIKEGETPRQAISTVSKVAALLGQLLAKEGRLIDGYINLRASGWHETCEK